MTKQELRELIKGNHILHDKNCGVTITGDFGNCDCDKEELWQLIEAYAADIGREAYQCGYDDRTLEADHELEAAEREAELEELNQISDIVEAMVDDAAKIFMLRGYIDERKKQLRKGDK